MTIEILKQIIINNSFVDRVRMEMVFDTEAYNELRKALTDLAVLLKGSHVVDRELMLFLYTMPTMIRNAFESLPERDTEFAGQLEDAWVELDELVTNCLAD